MARKDSFAKLRDVLVRRRDALRKAMAGDLTGLHILREQTSGDVVDAALDSAHNEISSQLAEVESRELKQIESALERMRHGTFGKCEGCGGAIPVARLQALPYAVLCIHCQQEMEQNGGRLPGRADDLERDSAASGGRASLFRDIEIDVS